VVIACVGHQRASLVVRIVIGGGGSRGAGRLVDLSAAAATQVPRDLKEDLAHEATVRRGIDLWNPHVSQIEDAADERDSLHAPSLRLCLPLLSGAAVGVGNVVLVAEQRAAKHVIDRGVVWKGKVDRCGPNPPPSGLQRHCPPGVECREHLRVPAKLAPIFKGLKSVDGDISLPQDRDVLQLRRILHFKNHTFALQFRALIGDLRSSPVRPGGGANLGVDQRADCRQALSNCPCSPALLGEQDHTTVHASAGLKIPRFKNTHLQLGARQEQLAAVPQREPTRRFQQRSVRCSSLRVFFLHFLFFTHNFFYLVLMELG
jgi:hypothetical protein